MNKRSTTPKASVPRAGLHSSRLRQSNPSMILTTVRSVESRARSSSSHSSSHSSRSSTDFRSNSIPVTKYIHRTPSELQLCEDEVIADYRDYCMYSRIVSGIIRQQMAQEVDLELRYQNDEILANVIRTRYGSDNCSKSATERIRDSSDETDDDDDEWATNLSDLHGHDEGVFVLEL